MKSLTVKRFLRDLSATWGVLYDYEPICVTLELPWRDNQLDISCIPTGKYIAKKVIKPKHGECFELQDVPNRKYVLLHSGNLPGETQGCLLLGSYFFYINGVRGVADSGKAYSEFWKRYMSEQEIEITILDP